MHIKIKTTLQTVIKTTVDTKKYITLNQCIFFRLMSEIYGTGIQYSKICSTDNNF